MENLYDSSWGWGEPSLFGLLTATRSQGSFGSHFPAWQHARQGQPLPLMDKPSRHSTFSGHEDRCLMQLFARRIEM